MADFDYDCGKFVANSKRGVLPANADLVDHLIPQSLLIGVRRFDSDRLWAILTLKGAFGVQNASRFGELPAPASRRQLGVYKQLFLIGMLETPVDVSA